MAAPRYRRRRLESRWARSVPNPYLVPRSIGGGFLLLLLIVLLTGALMVLFTFAVFGTALVLGRSRNV